MNIKELKKVKIFYAIYNNDYILTIFTKLKYAKKHTKSCGIENYKIKKVYSKTAQKIENRNYEELFKKQN